MSVTTPGRLHPLPLRQVTFTDRFWAPRLEANRRITLPTEYEQCRKTGRLDAWKLQWKPGDPNPPHIFWDSDVAKWIEAVGYSLATHPDAELERRVDEVVEWMAQAQGPDGYLNSHYLAVEPDKRWSNLYSCHELYCAGHLIEAAVAYAAATGKTRILTVLCRYADHIASVFGRAPGQKRGYCGHEEIELALVKLYRATGQRRYLELAAYFIDERGREPHYFSLEAAARGEPPPIANARDAYLNLQAHQPPREQDTVVGHAVRAMYLACGMADVAAETGDEGLLAACHRLWRSLVDRRLYITGGIGSTRHGERFTFDYDLPNETAYAETCAAIGVVFWAHRLLQLEAAAEYADVLERALYNGVAAGLSLSGDRFFYANPLAVLPELAREKRSAGHLSPERQEWFGCACCPPNIARLYASLGAYAYSLAPEALFVHLYVQGTAEFTVGGQRVTVRQRGDYPWREKMTLALGLTGPLVFTLALRLPGWCRAPQVRLNGRRIRLAGAVLRGYLYLRREWQPRDRVELVFPMPVERLAAHPRVRHNAGRVALQRGPLVYCVEEVDSGANLNGLQLPATARLRAVFRPDLLGGTIVITGRALRRAEAAWGNRLYQPAELEKSVPARVQAIPYCLWANRGAGEMLVWIPVA
jgi:uncharacterized protein